MSEIKLPEGMKEIVLPEAAPVKINMTCETKPDFIAKSLAEVERDHIIYVLENEKSKKRVVAILGISMKHLYNKIAEYGLREKYVGEYDKKK